MADYVVGFVVDDRRELIALMRKNRPAWQAGRLNGIGGHIEAGEEPTAAMVREFKEETGREGLEWRATVVLSGGHPVNGRGFRLHVFVAVAGLDEMIAIKRGATDELVELHPARRLPDDVIGNLHWLVPLCLDRDLLVGEVRETSGWSEPM